MTKYYIKVSAQINRDLRLFGYPIKEAIFVGLLCITAYNYRAWTAAVACTFFYIFGKIREKNTKDWLPFLFYSELKIKYPYFLPPGRKNLLP